MVKKKKIPRAAASPPWIELPSDVTANILGRLGTVEILQTAQMVCATWHKVCQDPAMWRVINIVYYDDGDDRNYEMMCRRAVDRSKGQLTDLTIEQFGDDALLAYIIHRSSRLRRLTLSSCFKFNMSKSGIREAVKKLPELEELHLYAILAVDIEAIGIACPKLKSFTYNRERCKHVPPGYEYAFSESDNDEYFEKTLDNNEHAVAITKFMPNLCHLALFANDLDKDGVQALLDGCPHLESLDIRQCFGVDLRGPLGIRCRQQIKDFKAPSDSVADYMYPFDLHPGDYLFGTDEESAYHDGESSSDDDDDDEYSDDDYDYYDN